MADERQDAADAFQNARRYHGELTDIYKFFMPFRQSTTERAPGVGQNSPGAALTDHLFDATGMSSAFNFAGNMVADWLPPFQDFFKLEAGPFWPEASRAEQNRLLVPANQMAHAVLGKARLSAHEMFLDLFAGTGAMYLSNGSNREPVRSQSAPIIEIALVDGPFGDVWAIYWKKNYKARHIEPTWPKGKFSDKLNEFVKNNKNADLEIVQATRYDPVDDVWRLKVWWSADDVDAVIFEEQYFTCPWMTPRFFKVPGESHGRGLAHLALPFVKSANKVRELELRAAAFALMGIWMRRNDGVFNPDTAVFKPLAMWTVATTGGPLGASLQRLPVPQDFDISNIVMADEREQIKRVLLDDELPELQDSVRSPTEIAARLRRAAKSKGGAGARISLELVTAMVQRTVEILEQRGMLSSTLKIDQLVTQCTVTAPSAAAQRADKVSRAVDWLQMMIGLFGPQAAAVVAKVDDMLPEMGRWMGVEETYIASNSEKKVFQEIIKGLLAQQQSAKAQAEAPPPAAGSQQYMNGAM